MKTVTFKYEEDDSISLGVPEGILAHNGNWRDGGCQLFFHTSPAAIGIDEKFALYLFAEDINKVSYEIWEAYFRTEPERAKRDFEHLVKLIKERMEKK